MVDYDVRFFHGSDEASLGPVIGSWAPDDPYGIGSKGGTCETSGNFRL